jgi:DNA-binding LacI/PurR family transcriptional regulator
MIIDEKSPIPKYFQLQVWLKEQIDQGIYHLHEKIPTEEELAKDFSLSRATITHAIQNLVDKGYLTRKQKLGTFVSKPAIQSNKCYKIGLILNYYKSGFGIEIIRGAGDKAIEHHCELILCNSFDLHVQAAFHADRLIEQGVSGVIYVPTAASDEKNRSIVQAFLQNRIPVVLADRTISELDVDQVITDNFDGAYNITNHLISAGHSKIAIVINSLLSSARQRLAGYKRALMDAKIAINPDLIFSSDEHFSEENCQDLAQMILTQKKTYTAIFAEHDKMAYTLCSLAQAAAIKIPEELSIVGYDDDRLTGNQNIKLTTIHQPLYEMGEQGIILLMKRMAGDLSEKQTVLLRSSLVERDSVRPLRQACS